LPEKSGVVFSTGHTATNILNSFRVR